MTTTDANNNGKRQRHTTTTVMMMISDGKPHEKETRVWSRRIYVPGTF